VAANTTLCVPPAMLSCDKYSGCASTLPSTGRVRSKPKFDELTFEGVSVDSVELRPLRLTSFL
jgi:hypothetical protein